MKNNELKKFAQMLSEELKKTKEISVEKMPTELVEESPIDLVSKYLSNHKTQNNGIKRVETSSQINEVISNPENIEKQRWADPLKPVDQKFVTFKDMNDHYGLFLQRIQQQMSSIGGGGEVKFRGLDDVVTSTTGTNKFLTYNPITKKFYFDYIGPATETEIGGIIPGPGFTVDVDGEISLNAGPMFELDGSDVFQLKVATETQFGGVKLGPGVTTNGAGQIIIDSSGLDFSFGDFGASVGKYSSNTDYAILQAINDDEDIVIASNGTGGIQVVGEFRVHATNGELTETLESNPIFEVKADGQVKILVPTIDSTAGGVSIVGSSTGEFISPVNTGVMLHVTGNLSSPGIPSRIYNDSQNAFAAFVARRFNGTVDAPTAVLANEEIMRISGTAHNGTTIPGTGNQRIVYKALGNQTLSNQGGDMEFWATPLNTTTIAKVATVGSAGITLESGKVLSGNVTGNADTATTSTNLAAASDILAGSISINPTSINKTSASTLTFTLTGLTTSHKIVITSGTALPYGLMIAGAWASALNTLSIEFHNYGGNVDQGETTIQYFAWV